MSAVPGVEDFLARVVCHHAVVTILVDKIYPRIGSTLGVCIVGVVDGGSWSTETVDAVYNTTRDKSITHVLLRLGRNTTVSTQRF